MSNGLTPAIVGLAVGALIVGFAIGYVVGSQEDDPGNTCGWPVTPCVKDDPTTIPYEMMVGEWHKHYASFIERLKNKEPGLEMFKWEF